MAHAASRAAGSGAGLSQAEKAGPSGYASEMAALRDRDPARPDYCSGYQAARLEQPREGGDRGHDARDQERPRGHASTASDHVVFRALTFSLTPGVSPFVNSTPPSSSAALSAERCLIDGT